MEQERIFLRFARKRERRAIALGILLGMLLLGIPLLADRLTSLSATILAAALFGGFGLFLWIDWRCPACDRHLGREFRHPYCSHCGTRLMP